MFVPDLDEEQASGFFSSIWEAFPSVPGKATAGVLQDTAKKVQGVLDNPTKFAQEITQGVIAGLSGPSAAQVAPLGEVPVLAGAAKTVAPSVLSSRISQLIMDGFSSTSSFVIQQLLQNSETYDLDEADKNLEAKAIKTLQDSQKAQKPVLDTAKSVWDTLNKYHIIIGGINLNIKTSSDEKMKDRRVKSEGSNNDGVSPIYSLVRCQEAWRNLRTQHALRAAPLSSAASFSFARKRCSRPTQNELAHIKSLVAKTDSLVSNFSQKTVHYATMYTIHRICNHSFDPAIYLKIIQEGGDIEAAYLAKFNGPVRQLLYKAAFRAIGWLIQPMIGKTIEEVIAHLRKFLNSDVDLLHLVEKKMGDMADYYGRIEKARRDYMQPTRTDECGTFDNFLKETIKVYGVRKLSENELINVFGNYIVDNFVPRPEVTFFGYHIPLISTFLEWSGHGIRKAIVRRVLNETGIVKKMLTQGTNSVHHAQLGLKRLVEQKLSQVCEMVTRSRSRPVVSMNPLPEQAVNLPPLDLEAKKTQLISRQLHLVIQQHSSKLLRFIDIESCNGDEAKLADLDNRVSALTSEIMTAISNVYKGDPFSLRKVLEDASNHAMETALLALFEDKEKQIEENLQTIFDVLDKSYTYVPEEERAERERQFLAECAQVDQNLSTLQEQLSRAAVAAALESHLKNVSGEKHNSIKAYVEGEKELHIKFVNDLTKLGKQLQINNPSEHNSTLLKETISQTVSLIEDYLSHITAQLPSPELEGCYSDVRGDLHNIYAASITHLNQLHRSMSQIAIAVNAIKITEDEIAATLQCATLLKKCSLKQSLEEDLETCTAIQAGLPKEIHTELNALCETIKQNRELLESTAAELSTFDRGVGLQKALAASKNKLEVFKKAEATLIKVKQECLEYHSLNQPNKTYPTKEAVEIRLAQLLASIQTQWSQLLKIEDADFQKDISQYLNVSNTKELYEIFFPSFFGKSIPIFLNLTAWQSHIQQACREKESEIDGLPKTAELRDTIVHKERELSAKFEKDVKGLAERLQCNLIAQQLKGDELKQSISNTQVHAFENEDFKSLRQLADHYTVKGCISVGEIKLYNRLAPELTARIAPEIIKGTRTMIDAMGKPFHYKQLVLRLLFLDIAERQAAEQE